MVLLKDIVGYKLNIRRLNKKVEKFEKDAKDAKEAK